MNAPAGTIAKSPRIERLAHVGLHVCDLEKSIHFYHDILGLA